MLKFVTPRWRINALAPQPRQLVHGIEIAGMLERPPVELQEIDRRRLQSIEAAVDAGPDDVGRHRAGRRAPLGEDPGREPATSRAVPATMREAPGDVLGTAVMVGHVEGIEACLGVGGHRRRGALRDRASRPSRSMSATCQNPVTMRLTPGPAQARCGRGALVWGHACAIEARLLRSRATSP